MSEYENEAILAFIGNEKKAEFFKELFKKYDKNPKALVFWLPAFLCGFWYLWYRRAFLEASIWFAVFWFFPLGFLAKFIFSSVVGAFFIPWILHRRYKKTKKEIEEKVKLKTARLELLKEKGGVSKIAIFIPSIFFALFIFSITQFSSLIIAMNNAKTSTEMTNVIIEYTEKNIHKLDLKEKEIITNELTELLEKIRTKKISDKKANEEMKKFIDKLWFQKKIK